MNLKSQSGPPNLLIARKIYHVLMGMICLVLYSLYLDRTEALWVLVAVVIPCGIIDLLRLRIPQLNALVFRWFGPMLKPSERTHLTGHTFFLLGLIVLVLFFEKPIVLLSVLFLSFGDPAASYVGGKWGRIKTFGGKSLEGTLANLVVSFIATAGFIVVYGNESGFSVLTLCAIGASVSAVSELLPFPIDDNFSIPVFSGLLLWTIHTLAAA